MSIHSLSLTRSQQKTLFLFSITLIYLLVITWLDFLRGPHWWDETAFWQSSLVFSDNLIPSLDELRNYNSLNTPLPFILFGALHYFFGGDIFVGRLLNLALSLLIVFIIGWPSREKGSRALLCLIGLFMCPYFLWLSGRLYTEMVACTWVLLGFVAYLRDRHFLSTLAFILAIASRQYMLAFPVAIAVYEFCRVAQHYWQTRQINWQQQLRWIAPCIAAVSIFGWFYLFQGLAPETATVNKAPEVQKDLWTLEYGGAVNFLAFIGAYIVIPEFILFPPQAPIQSLQKNWKSWLAIAVLLLIFCIISPPPTEGNGNIVKIARLLPTNVLQVAWYYAFALLACIRFCQPDLMFWLVIIHAGMMTKALPWDRYVLPLAVAFWYLKSRFPDSIAPPLQAKTNPKVQVEPHSTNASL